MPCMGRSYFTRVHSTNCPGEVNATILSQAVAAGPQHCFARSLCKISRPITWPGRPEGTSGVDHLSTVGPAKRPRHAGTAFGRSRCIVSRSRAVGLDRLDAVKPDVRGDPRGSTEKMARHGNELLQIALLEFCLQCLGVTEVRYDG
jgi:hypothetical protein